MKFDGDIKSTGTKPPSRVTAPRSGLGTTVLKASEPLRSAALALCLFSSAMWSMSCANELNEEEVKSLIGWIECEKCDDEDFAPVAALGERATDTLVAWLINGPPPARTDEFQRELETSYRQIRSYADTRPDVSFAMTEADYVQLYAGTYDVRYRYRTAQALARILGSRARPALDSAARAGLRPDVTRVIEMLRDSLPAP